MNMGYLIHLLWESGVDNSVWFAVAFLLVVAGIVPILPRRERPPKLGDGIEKRQPGDRKN